MDIIKEEHEKIERELIELETIMDEEIINYPNLIHTFHKLHIIWNAHEIREDGLFDLIEKRGFIMPRNKILFETRELEEHYCAVIDAISSNSEYVIRTSFNKHLRVLIKKLRGHQSFEEDIIFSVPKEVFDFEDIDSEDLDSLFT